VDASDLTVATDFCLTDVWAVLPERIVEQATIVVESGLIVSIVESGPTTGHAVSGRGSVCIPGIVDVHNVGSFDGATISTGVSTKLHPLRFGAQGDPADRRSAEALLCAGPTSRDPAGAVDHRPIVCLDLDDPTALDEAERCARRCTPESGALVVSIADTGGANRSADEAEAALAWFTIQALARRLRLIARAPASADDVDRAVDWGATAIEFPTSIEAARRAHERGMSVVGSAVDVVSAPTTPTAVSPLALIELGLCDTLASTGDESSLVDAVSLLVLHGVCDLRRAVRLVTSSPAELVGLHDRGRLASGLRGDLVLLHPDREHFRVRRAFRAGTASAAGQGLLAI